MAWSSLGSVNVSGSFQAFNTTLLNDELLKIVVSLAGDNVYGLKRLDFVEFYSGSLTKFAFSLPVKDLSVIQPFVLPPLFFSSGFNLRELRVKHNILGLSDTTVVLVEAFNWVVIP